MRYSEVQLARKLQQTYGDRVKVGVFKEPAENSRSQGST